MSSTTVSEQDWSNNVTGYAATVGSLSRRAGEILVEMAHNLKPMNATSHVLDVGAGTGALTLATANKCSQTRVIAIDNAPGMLKELEKRIPVNQANVSTQLADATRLSLSFEPNSFSHILSSFVLHFLPDPIDSLKQMYGILEPGGVMGIGLWGSRFDPVITWNLAASATDPRYYMPTFDFNQSTPTNSTQLRLRLAQLGLQHVRVEAHVLPFPFPTAQALIDYWFKGENPASKYLVGMFEGDMEGAKSLMRQIVETDYDDGAGLQGEVLIGVGMKPLG